MRTFRFLLLAVLFFIKVSPLLALEEEFDVDVYADFFNMEASRDEGVLSPPSPVFTHMEIPSFLPQIPKVNVITGEYHEEEVDFVVAGSEPLSIRRFYSHLGHKNQVYGHWSINPEVLMLFNFGSDYNKHQRFAGIGEESGNFILCENEQGGTFTFDPKKHKNFTNIGKSHPLNVRFSYNKVTPGRYENYWEGVIEDGLGGRKLYRSEIGEWGSHVYTGPAYQACIKEERKPNGNVIYYEYEDFNCKYKTNSHYKNLSTYYILRSISAYSSKGVFLGSIHLNYPDKVKDGQKVGRGRRYIEAVKITGSDGRTATFRNRIREVLRKKKVRKWGSSYERPEILDVVLDHVETPSKPTQSYNYRWEKPKYYFDHHYLFYAGQPEGRVLETTYDLGSKKVTGQNAPIGPKGEMLPIARYEYQNDHTVVYDGENQKTIYRFNDDKRITVVEKYDADQLAQVERNEWNSLNGNLIRKQIEDGTGHILQIREYEYDKNHNVIEESIGDGKSGDTIRRTFSDDGFNLKLTESDRPGKLIRYSYIPNTNLLSSEIIYEQDRIAKRIFHFYDDEITSVRVKTIVDDGHSENPFDLVHVTYRKILEIQPKREVLCVGLPEEVQEKTIDRNGNEILLKKVRYTYHPSGKIEREDHYDAHNIYRYSTINEYDEKERLIGTIDALGLRTTFTYDANFNLISLDGPRSDIHKEWSYDKINRPIQEREWQTDGTILISEKTYDKSCRLISQTDPCGFETRYEYNALGQLTAVIHPDGAVERKEYDALGNVLKEIDANGYIACKEYNFRSQPTAIYHSDGREEHFTYNTDGGTLATHTDPSGTKTIYSYDFFDNPIKTEVYSPEGKLLATTSARYSPFHKHSETNSEGITTQYTYDFAGRIVAHQIDEQIISYAYDELGRLTHTQEGKVITSNAYDVKSQLVEKRIDDLDNHEHFKESYTYDEAGNCISVATCAGISQTAHNSRCEAIQKIDPLGNTNHITYSYGDCFIKTTTNPKGIQTREIHDARGKLVDLQVKNASGEIMQRREKRYDPAGNQTHSIEYVFEGPILRETITHEWIYGPGGRIEKVIEAGEKTSQYFYDKAGRLKTIIKPDGTEIHREYDVLGRLSRYYGIGIDYVYTYDRKDRLLEVEDKVLKTTTNRVYDIYDNVIEEKLASGLTIRSHYDHYGRRVSLYLPDGSEVSYAYKGPYLYSVSRNGYTHIYSERNLAGKPTLITLPNNTGAISITWDPLLRWKKLHSPHYQANCSYDSIGNLTEYSYTDHLGSENNIYNYDDLNQLISENEHNYRYDSLYNRTAKDENTYSLNPLCQIIHDGQKEYIYDKNGNLISDRESSYEYDLLDRLIAVTKGKTRTTYTYDAFNRRVAKNNELYIWDDKKEIGISRGGKVRELRILGEGLGAEIGSSVIFEIGEYIYFPIHDIQGSLVTMIYPNGKPCGTYRYTAFGEQLTGDSSSPWRFASKRYDEETDFIYFGRRYYSPKIGRWITADPQGFDDGPNLYAYVHNSPFTTLDLHGLFSWWNSWTGMKNFGVGVGKHTWGMAAGVGHAAGRMGEWMVADSFYEAGDPSYFHAKSRASSEGWKSFGSAVYNDPIGTGGEMLVPGLMEAFRNPTSAESWGKAAVDIALIGVSVGKFGQASRFANETKIGEVAVFGKAGRAVGGGVAAEKFFVGSRGAKITNDWAKLSGMLKEAAKGKGNFGIGLATIEQANAMGKAWVGNGYRISSSGKAWISTDGMKQYRVPSHKPFLNRMQANFERKFEGQISQRWQANAHLDIIEYLELD